MVALFWMELHAEDIAYRHCTAEVQPIGSRSSDVFLLKTLKIKGMKKVETRVRLEVCEQRAAWSGRYVIPTHMWQRQISQVLG